MQDNKIKFIIPGFYQYRPTNMTLLDLLDRYPQYFKDDFEISGTYDGFPYDIWNGNGCNKETPLEMYDVVDLIKGYQKYGVSIYLNDSIPLKQEDAFVLGDAMSQNIAGAAESEKNGIIVSSKIMEHSIRISYPKFQMIYLDRAGEKPEIINQRTEQYNFVIASPLMNMVSNLTPEIHHPDKIALICNDACHPYCTKRQEEAELKLRREIEERRNNQTGVAEADQKFQKICTSCKQEFLFYKIQKLPTFITREKITHYVNQGFSRFVISGLNQSGINLIEAYVYYMAREEYRDTVRNILLNMTVRIAAETRQNRGER